LANYIEDADFRKTAYNQPGCGDCEVHQGFLVTYQSIKDEVLTYVHSLHAKYTTARIVVTGHSLGAAESMLGAVD